MLLEITTASSPVMEEGIIDAEVSSESDTELPATETTAIEATDALTGIHSLIYVTQLIFLVETPQKDDRPRSAHITQIDLFMHPTSRQLLRLLCEMCIKSLRQAKGFTSVEAVLEV